MRNVKIVNNNNNKVEKTITIFFKDLYVKRNVKLTNAKCISPPWDHCDIDMQQTVEPQYTEDRGTH